MCGSSSVFRIRIRIQKTPEYGSNTDPDPQHWSAVMLPNVHAAVLSCCPNAAVILCCYCKLLSSVSDPDLDGSGFCRRFGFLADPEPDSRKKVRSGSGQKDPDPKHCSCPVCLPPLKRIMAQDSSSLCRVGFSWTTRVQTGHAAQHSHITSGRSPIEQ